MTFYFAFPLYRLARLEQERNEGYGGQSLVVASQAATLGRDTSDDAEPLLRGGMAAFTGAINASYNYWSTRVDTEVRARIRDKYDDPTLFEIAYSPVVTDVRIVCLSSFSYLYKQVKFTQCKKIKDFPAHLFILIQQIISESKS